MKNEIALKVENVNKSFRLPTEQADGIKQAFLNRIKGVKGYRTQHVLDDVSFTIKKGDFFGIVGKNGSGKSTLLKLISGIYKPDCGEIKTHGSLVPFIELGVGFNPELTGRENVYMNGALLGFSNKEVAAIYGDIVDFAELHEFMDQKLKNYSSGMQVRLAFSIAIKAQGDILVLDEVLAVGDEAFQRKCYSYFAQLRREKKTVILVTHGMESVQQFCNRAMLINNGKIELIGNPAKVAQRYMELNAGNSLNTKNGDVNSAENANLKFAFKMTEKELLFIIDIEAKKDLEDIIFAFIIRNESGEWVYRYASDTDTHAGMSIKAHHKTKFEVKIDNILANGIYYPAFIIKAHDRSMEYAQLNDFLQFEINDYSRPYLKPVENITIQSL